jgi:hypothetical protein
MLHMATDNLTIFCTACTITCFTDKRPDEGPCSRHQLQREHVSELIHFRSGSGVQRVVRFVLFWPVFWFSGTVYILEVLTHDYCNVNVRNILTNILTNILINKRDT